MSIDFVAAMAAKIVRSIPTTNPVLEKAKGIEIAPAPNVALHRFATAPGVDPSSNSLPQQFDVSSVGC